MPKALFLCVEDLTGKRYAHAHDEWTARMPTQDEADILDLLTGTPVLNVLHVAKATDGTVLEISESTWPADSERIIDDYVIDQHSGESGDASDI